MSSARKPASTVTIRVPGTTANLGPGFDTLGIALEIYNYVRVTRRDKPGVFIESPIAEDARQGATQMMNEAARAFFRRTGQKAFGIAVSLKGEVPIARGLGSSVTARLGVVAGLNALTRGGLKPADLLELVSVLEHHPDNAAPAVYGGFAVAGMTGRKAHCLAFPVPSKVKFVTLIPRFEVSTEAARRLVPDSFSKADTVHNLNRASLITAAFAGGRYEMLGGLFEDRVHQPYRTQLIPQLPRVIAAGEKAGAIGGWLSGSGSTIVCMTLRNASAVAAAMRSRLPDSDVHILRAAATGAEVWRGEIPLVVDSK